MSLRSEKDRAKAQQEKFQAILSSLLKDDDNKYCEDCDAKGPRWASWNLGVFLCIRCAGIHRNLGVHISRVKSVNLDSWTPEQVAMMQEMGNSRARAVYEAHVQDSFRRPQTDSALEAFIRAKYEHKKYIAKEWVPPKPVVPKEWLEDDKAEKKRLRNKPTSNISLSSGPPSSHSTSSSSEVRASAKPASSVASEAKPAEPQAPKPKSGSDDLLGLDADVSRVDGGGGQKGGDLLADIFGGSPAPVAGQSSGPQQNLMATQQNGAAEQNLFDSGANGSADGQGEKKSAKDSIMALYGSGGGQQQMFGVPDMKTAEPNSLMSMPLGAGPLASSGTVRSSGSGSMTPDMGIMASNNPGLATTLSGQFASNMGLMAPGMGGMNVNQGMMIPNSGVMNAHPGMFSGLMTPNSSNNMDTNSGLMQPKAEMMMGMSANTGTGLNLGMNPSMSSASKPGMLSAANQQAKFAQSTDTSQTTVSKQKMGMMTTNAGMNSNTKSVSSYGGLVSTVKPHGASPMPSAAMTSNAFMYPGTEFNQPFGAAVNPYYYSATGGMYMPQQQMQQMYGTGGMQPMMQPQQGMMGQPMQQGMMGQPMQQGMMGMQQQQQQPGAMFGNAGQMGQNQMAGNAMGQGAMMGRPGGQMFMQQQPQQQMNPMQQQMQFQQMQQQMANMSMGGGQMGGMQQPQQAAVGGSWGGTGSGQTLSTNLWQ